MKKNDVIELDCRNGKNKELLNKRVHELKPFAKHKENEVKIEDLEKYVRLISKKYNVCPQWIMMDVFASNASMVYSCSVLKKDTREYLGVVYGASLYELMSKLAVKMEIEAKKVGKNNASE